MSAPQITCVIPTYEQSELADRAIRSVIAQRDVAVQIIVTDDSATGRIAALMKTYPPGKVAYRAGPRTGNPVENWNAGLSVADAPLSVLLHQDEWFTDELYLARAVAAMGDASLAAVIAGVAVTGVNRRSRFEQATRLGRILPFGRLWLPVINWIGPTAALVFRTGPLFDPALVQIVDVDFYNRVMRHGRVARLHGVSVSSWGHHDQQIAAHLDRERQALADFALLSARRPRGVPAILAVFYRLWLRLRIARRQGLSPPRGTPS